MKFKMSKIYYIFIAIMVLGLTVIGSTYAYFAAIVKSNNIIETSSNSYSISIEVLPVYHGFSIIPMDFEKTTKAINNKCYDKYDRGACSLYKIKVFGFNRDLKYISGAITSHSNINNLSYALLAPKVGTESEESCASITLENEEEKEYCYYNPHTIFEAETEQELFNSYNISNVDNVDLLLAIWLENEERSQNDDGVGTFSASVTIMSGAGGRIEGYISDAILIDTGNGENNNEIANNG